MVSFNNLSRRNFFKSTAALSFIYLPGIGRIQAKPYSINKANDYMGRLCYNENPLGPSPLALAAMNDATTLAHRYPDYSGKTVASGIYIFNLIQGEHAASLRATLLK